MEVILEESEFSDRNLDKTFLKFYSVHTKVENFHEYVCSGEVGHLQRQKEKDKEGGYRGKNHGGRRRIE